MADDDFIHNTGNNPISPTTSGFDATSDMAGQPAGAPPTPFSLAKGAQGGAPGGATGPSPMEVNAQVSATPFSPQNISTESLVQQSEVVNGQMQKAQGLLQDPALAQNQHLIKASTTDLLSQHLTRVNDNMTSLSAKFGTPLQASYSPPSSGAQAVAHFLSYLTGGQEDLANLTQSLKQKGGAMAPADLLGVQLKMSGVQQQMEFFTVLLGKAVDNIKTIMSIQS